METRPATDLESLAMTYLKINTDIALEFGREFDIYELLSSDEMSELRAGFEPVHKPTDEELNAMFSWYEISLNRK